MECVRIIDTDSPFSILSRFVVIGTLALILFPIDALAESGKLFYHAQDGGKPIQDNGGFEGRTVWEINLSEAPADAVITSVDIEYWINHTWVGDLKVWLTTEHNGEGREYVLWNREGGSTDNIYEKEIGLTTWNGWPANRKWYLCAADYASGDTGKIAAWKIWVYFDSATAKPQSVPYRQDFASGKPGNSQGWEYYSSNEGRIEVVDGQLRMDDRQDGFAYSLNEAILHLDLRGRSGVLLTLDHLSSRDEDDSLPSDFTGHLNGDGIAISADGIKWYLVTNLTSSFERRSFDLDTVVQAARISYSSDFRIKFQQFDNYSWDMDGRAFDNISVTATGADPHFRQPFGTWKGTFNSASYGASGTISDWIMRDDYTTTSKWELNVGTQTGIKISPSGTYSFNLANDGLDFTYNGSAIILADGQVTNVPCTLEVNGTVFRDTASGIYKLKLLPPNLPPVLDTGTWQVTRTPKITSHVFGIEICTGWNYNEPYVLNDLTYDFSLGLETSDTVSQVKFVTPAGYTFQIPSDSHTQAGNIQTWHYPIGTMRPEVSPLGLVAHWTMDDNEANTTVLDSSGRNNHGTARRNTSTLTTTGRIDDALTFNGTGDYIAVPDRDEWTFGGNFTISLWVKFNSFNANWWEAAFVGQDEGPEARKKWIFSYNPTERNTIFHINGPGFPLGGYVLKGNTWTAQAGVWYLLCVSRSGNTYTFYRQGQPDGTAVNTVQIPNAFTPLTIGWAEGARTFAGALDSVRIFNTALSNAEIMALYETQINRERWEYVGKFTSSDELQKYRDGTYTATVQYKDGSQDQTTAWFGIPNTTNVIPQPTQEPVLTIPKHKERTSSPVTFKWESCSDENATSIGLRLERQDSNECVDIRPAAGATSSDPIPLGSGIWLAKLFCEHWYDCNNLDGIPIQVGKYSECDYQFEIPPDMMLVAHWKMDDNAANKTVADSSGKGNHGAAQRNTSELAASGKIDGALTFDGIRDYVSVPDRNEWTFSGDFTIVLWVKLESLTANRDLIAHDEGPGERNKWIFSYVPGENRTVFHINGPSPSYPFGGYTIKGNPWTVLTGAWYFLGVSRSGNIYTFYRQGQPDGTAVNTVQIPNAAAPLTIGWAEGINKLPGSMDNVMIFNRALSNAEIKTLYDEGIEI